MQFQPAGPKEATPITVGVQSRADDGVAITIEGYVFLILNPDGTFRFNRFHYESAMGKFCRRQGIPTVKAGSTDHLLELTLR